MTGTTAAPAFLFLPAEEVESLLCHANTINALDKEKLGLVLKQIQEQSNKDIAIDKPTFAGFLNELLKVPDEDRFYLKPTADCDNTCVKAHNESVKDASLKQSFHIVVSIFSPATKLKLFGSQSLVEGKFLGEGKDSAVYALKGDSDWVVKVLKFGGAERAELLSHYINQLAKDVRLKIEPVINLGDGRLLQQFIEGTPLANQLWGKNVLNAQKLVSDLTNIAKEDLGLVNGKDFIHEGNVRITVDPSYANHLFDEASGAVKYQGNIDPIYTMPNYTAGR